MTMPPEDQPKTLSRSPRIPCKGRSTSRGGAPCDAYAVHGATVCSAHGGRAPQVIAAAQRRLAEAKVTQTLSRQLGPIKAVPVRDTLGRLSQLAGEMDAWKLVVGERVAELRELGDGDGRVRPEVLIFERALKNLGRLLVDIGRLDLDERMARLDRATAQAMADLFDRAMVRAGLSPAVQQGVREAFAVEVAALPRAEEMAL